MPAETGFSDPFFFSLFLFFFSFFTLFSVEFWFFHAWPVAPSWLPLHFSENSLTLWSIVVFLRWFFFFFLYREKRNFLLLKNYCNLWQEEFDVYRDFLWFLLMCKEAIVTFVITFENLLNIEQLQFSYFCHVTFLHKLSYFSPFMSQRYIFTVT